MIEFDPSKFRQDPPPYKHQLEGVRALVRNEAFYLGDKPRTCKSRQVVDAACVLRDNNLIDAVLIVGPVAARGVWGDCQMGQIKLYSWKRNRTVNYHRKLRELWSDENDEIIWIVTNYEYIRKEDHCEDLIKRMQGFRFLGVFDEAAALGNRNSQQSKAIKKIRDACSRVVMLNGSDETPDRYWSQFNILNGILEKRYKNFTSFSHRFSKWGPAEKINLSKNPKKPFYKTVHRRIGWKDYEKLSDILKPYCLRRERKDCPELCNVPEIQSFAEVELSRPTWKMYQQLKRDLLIELDEGDTYISPNAGVRLLRLAQICSGHLGGFEYGDPVRDFSSEKIDYVVEQIMGSNEPAIIAWCRWINERERLAKKLESLGVKVYQIHGSQNKAERLIAEKAFRSENIGKFDCKTVMVAQPQAGGIALDMSASSTVYRLSADRNLRTYEQSKDRPMGPAQAGDAVMFTDILAVGPDGQRTLDHINLAGLKAREEMGRWTTSRWRKELERE